MDSTSYRQRFLIFKTIISFLVYSNIWISAGAASFCWLYYQISGSTADYKVIGFLFFSTLLTYTYQRFEKISKKEQFHGPRMEWMEEHSTLVKLTMFIGIVGSIWLSLYLDLLSLFLLIILGFVSFLYAFKFNLLSRRTNLRDIPGIKIYLIGVVWALSCVTLPFIENEMSDGLIAFRTTGAFLYIVGITIPFDIRDIDLDEYQKKTIPQLVGINSSKAISASLLLGSYAFFAYPTFSDLSLGLGVLISIIFVLFANKNRNELYFSFVLDGLLVMVPVIYYLFQSLYPIDI